MTSQSLQKNEQEKAHTFLKNLSSVFTVEADGEDMPFFGKGHTPKSSVIYKYQKTLWNKNWNWRSLQGLIKYTLHPSKILLQRKIFHGSGNMPIYLSYLKKG